MKRSLLLVVILGSLLTACGGEPDLSQAAASQSIGDRQEKSENSGATNRDQESHPAALEALADSELTEGEIEGILFMREEEKLARDVYLQLGDLWGMNIFSNIAGREDSHLGAVLTLIELSNLEDPVQGLGEGEFMNQDLQRMYDDLVAQGKTSLEEALLVGAAIEEIDILDLQDYLAATDNAAVAEVYQNLLNGSINHLNAFVQVYERQTGETYTPQSLSEGEYQELIAAEISRGGGMGRGRTEPPQSGGRGRFAE